MLLGKARVHPGDRHALEGEIPCREPRVLPRVGHRDDVEARHVPPVGIALPRLLRREVVRVALEPSRHVVVIELLAPHETRDGLPQHHRLVGTGARWRHLGEELVRLTLAVGHDPVEPLAQVERGVAAVGSLGRPLVGRGRHPGQPQSQRLRAAGRNVHCVVQRGLGADPVRVHRGLTVHNVVVDAVLRVRRPVAQSPQALGVGLVVAEERLGRVPSPPHQTDPPGRAGRGCGAWPPGCRRSYPWIWGTSSQPGRPQAQVLRNHSVGSTCSDAASGPRFSMRDQHAHVGRRRLRVVDRDGPVPVVVKDARVDELELRLRLPPRAIGAHDVAVRESGLRVVVAPAHERVRRGGVEVPPVLFGVLAMVALGAAQPEDALLEDLVLAVPEREREAERLPLVADPGEPVLVPAEDPRAGMVVREVVPRGAVVAVVLPDGAPGALGQVRTPGPPRRIPGVRFHQSGPLRPQRLLTHGGYSSRSQFRLRKPPVHVGSVTPDTPGSGTRLRRITLRPPDFGCVHLRNADLRRSRRRCRARVVGAGRTRRIRDGDRQRSAHAPLPRAAGGQRRHPGSAHDGARLAGSGPDTARWRAGPAGHPRVGLGCGGSTGI